MSHCGQKWTIVFFRPLHSFILFFFLNYSFKFIYNSIWETRTIYVYPKIVINMNGKLFKLIYIL